MEQIWTISDERDVASCLVRHPQMGPVLQQIPEAVAGFFPDAEFRLEVRTDPESACDERLGVYIRTDVRPEKAVEQFVAFDSEWGDRFQDLTDGRLFLNIEAQS